MKTWTRDSLEALFTRKAEEYMLVSNQTELGPMASTFGGQSSAYQHFANLLSEPQNQKEYITASLLENEALAKNTVQQGNPMTVWHYQGFLAAIIECRVTFHAFNAQEGIK